MSVAKRRQMIEREHSLSIMAQCRLVSISRSSFYYAPVPEAAETLALMTVIDASFLDHPWYGSRQMARHLLRLGHAVGRRRVRRLMAKMGLSPIYRDCREFCARGRYRHQMTNRSPKITANWVFASAHSRGGRFHSWAAVLSTRYSSFIAASSPGK